MDIEKASMFLSCSILFSISIIVLTVATLVINNLIHKYWKSFGLKFFPMYIDKVEVPEVPIPKKR